MRGLSPASARPAVPCPTNTTKPDNGQAATGCQTTHGATCAPACDSGFELSGEYTCDTATGSWMGSPSCKGVVWNGVGCSGMG